MSRIERAVIRCTAALLCVLTVTSTHAADYGLQPGVRAPAFTLKDQDGNPQTIKSLSGPNGLLVLFNRSADWCSFCKSQLIDLDSVREKFAAKGIRVASVTYDSTDVLKAFATRKNINFTMLSDPDSATIDAFGVRNHTQEAVGSKEGIAIPNYFLISPDGTIKRRFAETEVPDRVTAGYIFEVVFGSGTAQPALKSAVADTPHLQVTLAQSDSSAAPGAHVRLSVIFTPEAGSHLYAPGAEQFGYHPIRLTLAPSSLFHAKPATYGQSTILNFVDLHEKVPVFEKATTLTVDISAVRSPETNAQFSEHPDQVVSGVLDYQVCTDKTCFTPEKKPVSWKLHVSPGDLDNMRVADALQRK